MRSIFIIALALLVSKSARAQITYLSDDRSVSGSGQFSISNVVQSYSQTNVPSAPFADFSTFMVVGFGDDASDTYSRVNAGQSSSLAANQISCDVSAAIYTSPGQSALAISSFDVSFSIATPTPFTFTLYDLDTMRNGPLTLSSADHGVILTADTLLSLGPITNAIGDIQMTGLLEPDIYTLQIQATNSPETAVTELWNIVMDVPEPATWTILGMGAVAVIGFRRRSHKQNS